jgi:hypothetical protein
MKVLRSQLTLKFAQWPGHILRTIGINILKKVMGECLEEESPWESKEVDGRMLFGGVPLICYRYGTGRQQERGYRMEIREAMAPKRAEAPENKKKNKMMMMMNHKFNFMYLSVCL